MKKSLLFASLFTTLVSPFSSFAGKTNVIEGEAVEKGVQQRLGRKDAYRLRNPKNPDQKILLVGSNHITPLTSLDLDLVQATKQTDVLVTELTNNERSWDASKTFNVIVSRLFESHDKIKLEDEGFISKTSDLRMQDTETNWIDNLDIATKQYLHELVAQSPLSAYGLSKIHPRLLTLVLQQTSKKLSERSGMDSQLDAYYVRSNKQVLGLETQRERQELNVGYTLPQLIIVSVSDKNLSDLTDTAKKLQSNKSPTRKELFSDEGVQDYINGKSEENVNQLVEQNYPTYVRYGKGRNELWAPRIIKYLAQYPDKSFTIMVGSFHMYGPDGLIELFKKQDFDVENF